MTTQIPPGGVTVTATQMASAELGRRKSQYTMEIAVKDSNGAKLGDLSLSKGGVDWRPRYQQQPIRASWADFIRWMES